MLLGDAREAWNGGTMADTRVLHFWDGEGVVGKWFARQVYGYDGIIWDYYYLFGSEAAWEDTPASLVGARRTIYGKREALEL